jgi:hypothetical protein
MSPDHGSHARSTPIARANVEQLRAVFERYASVEKDNGKRYMTPDDFIRK